jgi:hypothetical protein
MRTDKLLLLILILGASVSVLVSLKYYFVSHGVIITEGFKSYSTDFSADMLDDGAGKCRCKNGNIGDVALYVDADACSCNSTPHDRDRPELMPGALGQQFRNKHPYYDLNCHLRHNYDAHIDITQPYKPQIEKSQPMKYQTYKKNAYVPCTSILNDASTYEEQYKLASTSMTKRLQDKPYLYTTFEDDKYFENWAK